MNSPEFRLYYDDTGKVLCYTCEILEGNYIIVDKDTYLACRFDIKIVDQKIYKNDYSIITKLVPNSQGTSCHKHDVSIIDQGSGSIKWRLNSHDCN